MVQTLCEPSIEQAGEGDFVQSIRIGDPAIARARWHTPGAAGVAQVLELWVDPEHGRRGMGRALVSQIIQQARGYFRARGGRLRRLWLLVGQKDQVAARAFLLQQGFHQTATIPDLLRGQDAMVYVRSF